jgi:hypothetical protein
MATAKAARAVTKSVSRARPALMIEWETLIICTLSNSGKKKREISQRVRGLAVTMRLQDRAGRDRD